MSLAATLERSKRDREEWRYTDLAALLKPVKTVVNVNAPLPHLRAPRKGEGVRAVPAATLLFHNGVFDGKKSRFGSVPSCILMGDADSGYKLTLGEQTCLVAQPIEMVFTADRDCAIQFDIELGQNGRLTLLENHAESSAVTVMETAITLHDHAKFVHGKMVRGGAHLARTQARLGHGSYYDQFSLLCGGRPVRNEIHATLAGSDAQIALNGVMLGRGDDHLDTTTRITHAVAGCASRQTYKTILDGAARGVFQGKITVAEDAQKTDGYQLSRALLLSDKAEMDAKPELEIYADDVKCSHGSTIGDLDTEALFYLRSRGLNEAEARALLMRAFIAETIDAVAVEECREGFYAEIDGWMG